MNKKSNPTYQELRAFNMDSVPPIRMNALEFNNIEKMASHAKWIHDAVKISNDGKFMDATYSIFKSEVAFKHGISIILATTLLGVYLNEASYDESFITTLYGSMPTVIIDDEEVPINNHLVHETHGVSMQEAFMDLLSAELHEDESHRDILIIRCYCALFGLN